MFSMAKKKKSIQDEDALPRKQQADLFGETPFGSCEICSAILRGMVGVSGGFRQISIIIFRHFIPLSSPSTRQSSGCLPDLSLSGT